MRDVAALAGVSLKTVSRVINREDGVSDTLVQRVHEAALRLEFRPNLTASSLRRTDGRTRTIGLLLDDVANPFSSALHRAVEDVAHERDVVVLAGSQDGDGERERELATAFTTRRVDGLIVVPSGADHGYLRNEQVAGTALVFVDRPPRLIEADSVVSSNAEGAERAVAHLIEHGHRRIALLRDRASVETSAQRRLGWLRAHERAGLVPEPALEQAGLDTVEGAEECLGRLLDADEPPTAVFAGQNLITVGALRALRARGLHHVVALVGFDEVPLGDLLDPGITVVVQDVVKMGRLAAHILFEQLDGANHPIRAEVVPTSLVARGSGEIQGPWARTHLPGPTSHQRAPD